MTITFNDYRIGLHSFDSCGILSSWFFFYLKKNVSVVSICFFLLPFHPCGYLSELYPQHLFFPPPFLPGRPFMTPSTTSMQINPKCIPLVLIFLPSSSLMIPTKLCRDSTGCPAIISKLIGLMLNQPSLALVSLLVK